VIVATWLQTAIFGSRTRGALHARKSNGHSSGHFYKIYKTKNVQLQAKLLESHTVQRKQYNQHLVMEMEWKVEIERIKRDFDTL
jgi:hypothetical protein